MSFVSARRPKMHITPTIDDEQSTNTTTTQLSTKAQFKDKLQSLGILAMIILIIVIGFQMTDSDVYNDINKQSSKTPLNRNTNIATPSPIITVHRHPPDRKIIVHEDDGDVEVDIPQQLLPDIPNPTSLDKYATKPRMTRQRRDEMRQHLLQRTQSRLPHSKMGLRNRNRTGTGTGKPQQNRKNHNPNRGKPLINFRSPYHDPDEDNIILPTIEQMSKNNSRRFYSPIDTPAKLYGYDLLGDCKKRCPRYKYAFVSGLYNTGTNVVYRLIAPNCMASLRFQPGWGKHEMFDDNKIEHFNTHDYPSSPKGIYKRMILIVVVKDPLTWFKSMCKANYDFRYFNRTWFFNDCPTGISNSKFDWLPMNRGKVMNLGHNRTSNGIWESPIHLWNDWYSSVVNKVDGTKWPYVIVRFEDLLFRVDSVVKQFCQCIGQCKFKPGVNEKHIRVSDKASKPHGHPRNRTMSFWAYSRQEYRYDGYTREDLQYMLDALDPKLLELFGYQFDVDKTMRMRL